ncbi:MULTISPECIES: hypothetical protein [Desulfitobacterium]|uniref:Uncharacterized protein n=2 Tax=root TaxID=1 RepID=A0A098B1J2_DESHA|nr:MULTISPECIES: hypothetical protein [Desulfitobacterium]MEA5022449.1 hypothetical protein [Desulfitobacterium hafniense]CDX02749.1 Hypothetical protein DPCES_2862 [Desulfitobacterium hafniense]
MTRGTQIINRTEYVYEDLPYWDTQKKRGAHKRIYIGKNVKGEFIPNKKYLLQQELKKAKETMQPGSVPVDKRLRQFYGAVYLLDQIGEMTGITHDLKLCLPGSYKQMLSIIYYLILESRPLYRFQKWNRTHRHP